MNTKPAASRRGWKAAAVSAVVLILAVPGGLAAQPAHLALEDQPVGPWGIDLTDRDAAVRPGDDFYMSQNGGWFARTQLGPQLGMSAYWRDLRLRSPARLIAVLQELAAGPQDRAASPETKAGAFFKAFMDVDTVEQRGLSPLAPELARIRAATTYKLMAAEMGREAGPGSTRALNVYGLPLGRPTYLLDIVQDPEHPDRSAVLMSQGGLLLPGPEYYLEPGLVDTKTAYEAYVARVLTLIGWRDAEAMAHSIVAMETRVAAASTPRAAPSLTSRYDAVTRGELRSAAPTFDWDGYLDAAGLAGVDRILTDSRAAIPAIATIYAETPLEVLQARQAFAAADDAAPLLNKALFEANFDFRTRAFVNPNLNPRPREFYAEQTLSAQVPDILSAIYVSRFFPASSKALALEISENLRGAFDKQLSNAAWMSPETRKRAREKLANLRFNVGYPDRFESYNGLEISSDDLYGDVARAKAYNWSVRVRRLGETFDRNLWTLAAETANYNYTSSTNTVEIPAGSLQPPFFDPRADPAVNYGAIGALIGLSIASGFGETGRHFDGQGRLSDWWTEAEVKHFEEQRARLAAQYSAMEPLPGVHVRGELVVDEALADIAGLRMALDAYHLSLKGKPAPMLAGFSGDQRVFLGWASMWRAKFDPSFVRNQLVQGQNSPPFLRVNGPMANLDVWYAAFGVRPGDRMYLPPEQRVQIW